MSKFDLVKRNFYWLPIREVEHTVFDFFDLNGTYTQGVVKANADGTYTLSVTNDPEYEDFSSEPFTGSAMEVMEEVASYCEDDSSDELFDLFYQAGDVAAVMFLIAERVGNDVDDDFLKIPLGHQFFEANSFYCFDSSKIDIEAQKALLKREEIEVDSPSIEDFVEEIFNLYEEVI